jgi:hypothetical protein
MTRYLRIPYTGCPMKAVKKAKQKHGDGPALIMIPQSIFHRLVPKKRRKRNGT